MWISPHGLYRNYAHLVALVANFLQVHTTISASIEASGDLEFTASNLARDSHDIVDTTIGLLSEVEHTTAFIPSTAEYKEETTPLDNEKFLYASTVGSREEMDIVTIVGAVCGIAGIFIGIIISAAVWFYVTKTRMRRNAATIPKNPEEKTFERLDFTLTLPRNKSPSNSPSSAHDSLPDSGYMHFEEPSPFANDTQVASPGRPEVTQTTIHHEFTVPEPDVEVHYEECPADAVFGYAESEDRFFDQAGRMARKNHMKYAQQPRAKHQSDSSFGVLLQKDLSEGSFASKRSSSVTGVERTSSICTCRTDLPDSDGSNCSTCGASVSVTSSLARDKTTGGVRELHIHDLMPRSLSHVPSPRCIPYQVPRLQQFDELPDMGKSDFPQDGEMSSLSSSDSFINEHDNGWYDNKIVAEREPDDPLKYFDLELPPSTFSSPRKLDNHSSPQPKGSEAYESHDDLTIVNSEVTIDL